MVDSLQALTHLRNTRAVCDVSAEGDTDIFDSLLVLVESHLVTHRRQFDGDVRFGMLATIREFATERLVASGEVVDVRRRHVNYYIDLAETQQKSLDRTNQDGTDQITSLDRLEREHDNFRTALDWLVACRDTERGLRLVGSLWMFWLFHGHLVEGLHQFGRVLALPATTTYPTLLAKALTSAGLFASFQDDDDRATQLANAALSIWQDLPAHQQRGSSIALFVLASVAMQRGDFVTAEARVSEMLPLARRTNDGFGIRCALAMRGVIAGNSGNLTESRRDFEECLEHSRTAGDELHVATMLANLAVLEQVSGRYASARPLLEEAIEIQRRLGTKVNLESSLRNLGENARSHGDLVSAEAHNIEALVLARELGKQGAICHALCNLGQIRRQMGDLDRSLEYFREGLQLSEPIRHTIEFASTLAELASLRLDRGEPLLAVRMLAAADALYCAIGVERWPDARQAQDELLATARGLLPQESFEFEWNAARSTPLDGIVREVIEG